jgi:hypothetical protein
MTTFLFVLLADETPETYGKGVKFLAVLGGAVVGGFLVGFLCSLMARALSGQKMNAWALRIVRILGAIISGWIMWWFIFGPGGGFGWPGGPGTGPGTNHTGTGKDGPTQPKQDKDQPPVKDKGETPAGSADPLRIEVLSDKIVNELDPKALAAKRWFAVLTENKRELRNLEELKKEIVARREQKPPLKQILITIYQDSPDESTPRVNDLTNWIREKQEAAKKTDTPLDLEIIKSGKPTPR